MNRVEPVLVIVGAGKVLHLRGSGLETLCGVERRWNTNLCRIVTTPRRGTWRSEQPGWRICAHCIQGATMRADEWRALGVIP